MASTTIIDTTRTDTTRTAGTGAGRGPTGRGIVLTVDRSRAFVRARRHSFMVRTLRIALPLASVLMVAGYVMTVTTTARLAGGIDRGTRPINVSRDLSMDNPRYEGVGQDGARFLVTAKRAVPDLTDIGRVKLEAISGELVDARRARTEVTAARGDFDTRASTLVLSGGITIATDAGLRADLDSATVDTRKGTIVSDRPTRISAPQGAISAARLEIDQRAKRVAFVGTVVTRVTPPAAGGAEAVATPAKATPLPTLGASRAPVDVTADRLDIDDAGKLASFSGRVRAAQGEATIETDRLDITYQGGPAAPSARPAADAATPAAPAASPGGPARIERMVAPGPIAMAGAGGARVTGNRAEFDAVRETAVVDGDVVVTSGPDRRATATRAEVDQRADTYVLAGDVVVTQGRNELRGRRLVVDRKAGRTELSAPASATLPKGRISTRLAPNAAQPGKPARPKAAEPAAAVPAGLGVATFKTDPDAPVDVDAEQLVVDDTRKEAVFTGGVRAVQGEFTIRSASLKATYAGETGLLADAAAAAAPATPGKAATQLTRIDARGRVIVTSTSAQQVTGDWAVFDTRANTVTVGGTNVVLTQGPNVVTGSKLVIDMTTGQSTIVREQGRSRLVLHPSTFDKDAGKAAALASGATAATGSGATASGATPPKAAQPGAGATPPTTTEAVGGR
jgi:lipopolysaccharide export system protein LptA